MTSPERYGVFLEPNGELKEIILRQKERVEAEMPGQPYCNHPPHATLLFGCYHSADIWLELLEDLPIEPFEVGTDGYELFTNDAMAGGGHTVAHRLAPTEPIKQIQWQIAEVLEDFVEIAAPDHAFDVEPLATSQQRFGFPFVGNHWLPHMTIASIAGSEDGELIRSLMAEAVDAQFVVDELAVWQVLGDEHREVGKIQLNH